MLFVVVILLPPWSGITGDVSRTVPPLFDSAVRSLFGKRTQHVTLRLCRRSGIDRQNGQDAGTTELADRSTCLRESNTG